MGERQGQCVPPLGPVGGVPPNVGVGAGVGVGIGVGGRRAARAMLVQQIARWRRERSGSLNPAQVRRVTADILQHDLTLLFCPIFVAA